MGNKKRLIIGLTILAVIIATSTLLHVEFITPASAETDISLNIFIADLPNWASFANNVMFDSTKVISNGRTDIYLAKYSLDGNLGWIRSAGGELYD